ncbi:MAG: CBS domain-containing protein [Alphaproteobacteria bacterium]
MQVADILASKGDRVITTRPDSPITKILRTLTVERIGVVVATDDDGALVGILSERDIIQGLHEQGDRVLRMKVEDLMTSRVVTCTPDDSIEDVMKLMSANSIRHLPVVDGGRLAGVLSIVDVVNVRVLELEQDKETLRTFMSTRIE